MNRIILIGCGGAGKSTLSRKISEKLELPLYHLDRIFWNKGWVETPKDQFDEDVKELINKDKWIIDGNYRRTLDMRVEKADTVIFINMPTYICIYRVIKRRLIYRNKSRPDIAEGCVEGIDFEFFLWILTYNRKIRPSVFKTLSKCKNKNIIILNSKKEVNKFMESI